LQIRQCHFRAVFAFTHKYHNQRQCVFMQWINVVHAKIFAVYTDSVGKDRDLSAMLGKKTGPFRFFNRSDLDSRRIPANPCGRCWKFFNRSRLGTVSIVFLFYVVYSLQFYVVSKIVILKLFFMRRFKNCDPILKFVISNLCLLRESRFCQQR
jgi:hypothetical protein